MEKESGWTQRRGAQLIQMEVSKVWASAAALCSKPTNSVPLVEDGFRVFCFDSL